MTETVNITTNWGVVHNGCHSILLVSSVDCQIGVNSEDDTSGSPSGTVFANLSANEMRRFDFEDEPFKVFVKGDSAGTLDYQVLWEGRRRQYPATSSIVLKSDYPKDLENIDITYDEGESLNSEVDFVLKKIISSGIAIHTRLGTVESWKTIATTQISDLETNKIPKVASTGDNEIAVFNTSGNLKKSSKSLTDFVSSTDLDTLTGPDFEVGMTVGGNAVAISNLDTNKASVTQLNEVKGDGWTNLLTLMSLNGSISTLSSNKANKVSNPTVDKIVVLTSEGDIAQSSYTVQEIIQQGQTNAIRTQYKETPEGNIVLSAELSHFSAGRIKIPVGSSVIVPVGTEWWVV